MSFHILTKVGVRLSQWCIAKLKHIDAAKIWVFSHQLTPQSNQL